MPEAALRRLLFDVLPTTDGPGSATVLGALGPLPGGMPASIVEARREGPPLPSVPGSVGRRGTAIALALWPRGLLAGQTRCGPDDACPSCRDGAGCPRDTWPHAVAALAIADTEAAVDAFWSAGDAPATQGPTAPR